MPQHTASKPLRWSLLAAPVVGVLVLAGCSGATSNSGDGDSADSADAGSFTLMVAQANDADDFYAQMVTKYSEETGAEIEVIPYPSDAYNTQVTTQLQAGNAADVMILSPGTGQPISVVSLAEAGFLEPLDDTSAGVIPEGTENLYEVDGKISPKDFTIRTIEARVRELGDLWAGLRKAKPADLATALEKLQ